MIITSIGSCAQVSNNLTTSDFSWNAEIFSHHKKSKGVVDGECETIMLADESEQIVRDMEDFRFEAESGPGAMPVNLNINAADVSLNLSPIICP